MPEKPTLLIVDDDQELIELSKNFLKNLDCKIVTNTNVLDAIKTINSENISLIICDIEMHPLSGFHLIGKLKASNYLNAIPIIVLSANNDKESIDKAISLGANDYLIKPFNSFSLQKKIRRILCFNKVLKYNLSNNENRISLSTYCKIHSISDKSIKIESKIHFNINEYILLIEKENISKSSEPISFVAIRNNSTLKKNILITELIPSELSGSFQFLKEDLIGTEEKQ